MQAQNEQYADEYRIHMLLGEGGQANVYLGSKENQLFALKVYLPGASKEAAYKIQADFLAKLNFPHLINMVDHRPLAKFKLENRPEEKRPLIVLELAEGGELFEFISKLKNFSPEVTRTYLKQILAALKYLNDIGVTHRDLKPENILFDRNFKLKISDFGLSRDTKGDLGDGKLRSRVGTEGYKPPEMEQGNYEGIQADIFAAGVVLFIMYNGTPPFLSTKTHDRIYKLIRDKNFQRFWTMHERNKPKGFFPDSFKRLINSFFSAEPDRRPTFESLESDEWLNGDELMENELREYMGAKAVKLAENDPNKIKMAELSKKLCADKLMEEECCEEGSRGVVEDPSTLSKEELFAHNYRQLKVRAEELPEYTLKGVVYGSKDAAFVVAWLQGYLTEQFKAKNAFMSDFIEEIAPVGYSLELGEKGEVKVKLEFEIEEEDQVELWVKGQLHRNAKGEVSVEWTESAGNSYWVNNVLVGLNGALQQLK